MAKLDEVLKLVRLYEEKYRHPNLTRFLVSNKYDLFPEKENTENCWPQCYPYADRPGVYLIMDGKEQHHERMAAGNHAGTHGPQQNVNPRHNAHIR